MEWSGGQRQAAEVRLRRTDALAASIPSALAELAELLRGRVCDLGQVALDDQGGKVHIPVLERLDGAGAGSISTDRPPGERVAGELVVRRVVEFSVEGAGAGRWFELDALVWDGVTRRLSVTSTGPLRLHMGVEGIDVALRWRDPEEMPSARSASLAR